MASTHHPGETRNAQELRAEIEQTREELGATVEQLVALADVKARAKAEAAKLAGQARNAAVQGRKQAAAQADRVLHEHPAPVAFAVTWVLSFAGLTIWQWRRRG
jgi:hypothetical protein